MASHLRKLDAKSNTKSCTKKGDSWRKRVHCFDSRRREPSGTKKSMERLTKWCFIHYCIGGYQSIWRRSTLHDPYGPEGYGIQWCECHKPIGWTIRRFIPRLQRQNELRPEIRLQVAKRTNKGRRSNQMQAQIDRRLNIHCIRTIGRRRERNTILYTRGRLRATEPDVR